MGDPEGAYSILMKGAAAMRQLGACVCECVPRAVCVREGGLKFSCLDQLGRPPGFQRALAARALHQWCCQGSWENDGSTWDFGPLPQSQPRQRRFFLEKV
jgi:hypothetical protein